MIIITSIIILIILFTLAVLLKNYFNNNKKILDSTSINASSNDLQTEAFNLEVVLTREEPIEISSFRLLNLEDGKQELNENILRITKNVPRPHPILIELTKEINSIDELYEIVKKDPEIAAKILQTINSPAFYLSQEITRLDYAVLYLGTTLVKDIALKIAITDRIKANDPIQNRAFNNIWNTSFIASTVAFHLAQSLALRNASELATQSLLLSIGKIAVVSSYPHFSNHYIANMSLLDLTKLEQQELKTNSPLLGGILSSDWRLPLIIQQSILNGLLPLAVHPKDTLLNSDDLQRIAFCYTACRYAELIINNNIKDVSQVNLAEQDAVDIYYLPDYFGVENWKFLTDTLQTANFHEKVNSVINKIIW